MRALGAAVAAAYIVSFVFLCLSGCMAAAPVAHGCCQGEDGLTAAGTGTDCCTLIPGLSVKQRTAATLPFVPTAVAHEVAVSLTVVHHAAPARVASGPPLILRI